jgi:hypothetical protein
MNIVVGERRAVTSDRAAGGRSPGFQPWKATIARNSLQSTRRKLATASGPMPVNWLIVPGDVTITRRGLFIADHPTRPLFNRLERDRRSSRNKAGRGVIRWRRGSSGSAPASDQTREDQEQPERDKKVALCCTCHNLVSPCW